MTPRTLKRCAAWWRAASNCDNFHGRCSMLATRRRSRPMMSLLPRAKTSTRSISPGKNFWPSPTYGFDWPRTTSTTTATRCRRSDNTSSVDSPGGLVATAGIGARVPRKEDARHLAARGSCVPDMVLPRQREVAFLRSPIAHGRIVQVGKPVGYERSVFVRDDIADMADVVACNTVPGYRIPKCPPVAQGKV